MRTDNLKTLTGPDGVAVELVDGAAWKLTHRGRAVGGVIRGGAGTGKTTLMHAIARAAAEAGQTTTVIDPLGRDTVLPPATRTARDMRGGAILLAQTDNELTDRIADGQHESHLVFVDHAEYLLDDRDCRDRIYRIAELGGKVGLALTLVCTATDRINPRLFDGTNTVAFDYSYRPRTGGFGLDWIDLTDAPAHYRDPITGTVTGFDPRA